MKTTIDIADDLIKRAKIIQARDHVTLRSLIEDGLRDLLEKRSKPAKYKFKPVVVGGPDIDWSMTPAKINGLIDEMRDRSWKMDGGAEAKSARTERKVRKRAR